MSWTYRVARTRYEHGAYYDIREWYDELPNGPAWSADSEAPMTEDINELIWELRHMLKAAKRAKRNPDLILDLKENGDES